MKAIRTLNCSLTSTCRRPQVAQSPGSTVWVIPSEVTTALRTLGDAFGNSHAGPDAVRGPMRRYPGPGPCPCPRCGPLGLAAPAAVEDDDGEEPGASGATRAA